MGSSLGTIGAPEPRFKRHLKDLFPDDRGGVSLEALFAAAEAVRAAMATPGWVHLSRLLEAEIAEIDRGLDGGSEPLKRAEYAMRHGRRSGLRGVDEAAGAILREAEIKLRQQRAKHEDVAAEPVAA